MLCRQKLGRSNFKLYNITILCIRQLLNHNAILHMQR